MAVEDQPSKNDQRRDSEYAELGAENRKAAAEDIHVVDTATVERAVYLPQWAQSNILAAIVLTIAGVGSFFSTWFLMSPAVETTQRSILIALIVANIIIALGFAALVGARLFNVWSNRRNRLAGSRMHMQLVRLFSLIAIVPAAIAFLFAFTILRTSLNDVFSERIDNYQETAREIANGLVEYVSEETRQSLVLMAVDIHRNEEQNLGFGSTPIGFREYLKEIQTRGRGFVALYVMDSNRNIISRIELEEGNYSLPSASVFDQVDAISPYGGSGQGIDADAYRFGANDFEKLDFWRGVIKTPTYGGGYLVVYRPIVPAVAQRLQQVRLMAADWEEAERGRRRLERVFVVGYIILGLTILFGAIWLGLTAANQIVSPIGRLVGMADKVSGGDLGARVSVLKNDGEVGELARSMNRMTAQLQTQRNDLIDTNRQFDRRRRFTEAVLSGVTSGVLGISAQGRITIANQSAADLLGVDILRINGVSLTQMVPEFSALFETAKFSLDKEVGGQVDLIRNGSAQIFNVRIVRDGAEAERTFVMTIDDITQLISAQRNAAWGDVARRIAHEIKNPLTPIQLSAERLRRKYLADIKDAPEVFDKCTDTIIRQVHDIGRMVDEFSSFARMPAPDISAEDIRELVKSALFPQRVTFPDITFDTKMPPTEVMVDCDGRLIVQALTNLLKNAAESVTTKHLPTGPQQTQTRDGKILVQVETGLDGAAVVSIIDNGIGFPKKERHRLTEPYMTTREKGTGLGLAIVKKVTEDHGGSLSFEDDQTLGLSGARVILSLPLTVKNANNASAEEINKVDNNLSEIGGRQSKQKLEA